MTDELVRQQSWPCAGPAELELSVDVGRIRIELAEASDHTADGTADATTDGTADDTAGEVRVEVRHDPAAGPGWAQGLSGLINWLGAAGPFDLGHRDPETLAVDAVTGAEITWTESARRLVVRSPEELPLRVVPLVVTVHAPSGSAMAVRTGAGDIVVTGSAGRSDVTTGSGDVTIDAVAGPSRLRTGSGRIDLGAATGRVDVKAGSGDVRVGELDGELRVRAGSGDVAVTDARSGSLELATGSGQLRVAVHPGVGAELDLTSGSGRARSELDVEHVAPATTPALRVRGRTGSGDVVVTRAAVPA